MGFKVWEVRDNKNQCWRYFRNEEDAILFRSNDKNHRTRPECIHIIIKAELLDLLNSLS